MSRNRDNANLRSTLDIQPETFTINVDAPDGGGGGGGGAGSDSAVASTIKQIWY